MDNCPKCGVSWIGEEIPEEYKHLYSVTHYGRQIGIDGGYIGVYDGIVAIRCPDCEEEFPRSDDQWALEMFERYKKAVGRK